MAYKTVLVHCNDLSRVERVVASGVQLAEQFQAHLIGLSVSPPILIVPTGTPGVPDTVVIDERRQAYRKHNPEMQAAFESAVRGRSLVAEWREADAGGSTVVDVVLRHARAVDLIVAPQADTQWSGSPHLDVADRLAMESGRPVLIVPNEGLCTGFGEKVLAAWNAEREAARAIFDALPLLQRAKKVQVVWVNPQSEGGTADAVPAADICEALARHGVKCEATQAIRPRANVGRTLLEHAVESGADLLVMGCYGHSRLREFVLGGATRHVLDHMSIPVLMSH